MKVIYKKSVVEKIDDAIIESKKQGKEIDLIVLNGEEWSELYDYVSKRGLYPCVSKGEFMFCGVKIAVE